MICYFERQINQINYQFDNLYKGWCKCGAANKFHNHLFANYAGCNIPNMFEV